MPSFQIPEWRKALITKKYRRKDRVIAQAVKAMDELYYSSVDYIFEHYDKTGRYVEPPLSGMESVGEAFYRKVISEAFHDAKDQKSVQGGRKKLAQLPVGLPKSLRSLEEVFRDRQYWPRIMKRNKVLMERLRKSYWQKLKRKFRELVPRLLSGEISSEDAKSRMIHDWAATKPRVETIFRTETTNYFGKTQVAYFSGDPDILGFLFDSVKDNARTDVCRTRHGLIYRPDFSGKNSIAYNTPALHYNCRSHLIPLANTAANRKMIADPTRNPSRVSVAPLPSGWRGQGTSGKPGPKKRKSK